MAEQAEQEQVEAPIVEAPVAPQLSETESVLRFDPFGESEPVAAAKPEVQVESETDGSTQTEAPVAPAEPVSTVSTVDPALAALMERQTQLLETALKPPVQPEVETPELPRFNVQLPDGLIAALNSEEPADRALAINSIVNGVANMAFAAAKELVTTRIAELQTSLPTYINQHTEAATTQRSAQEMFYNAYPKLADPAVRATVGSVAQEVGKEWMASGKEFQGMTPEFAAAIAARVAQKFGVPVDVFKATPAANSTPTPTPQRFAAPPSTRPAPQPSGEDQFAKFGLDF